EVNGYSALSIERWLKRFHAKAPRNILILGKRAGLWRYPNRGFLNALLRSPTRSMRYTFRIAARRWAIVRPACIETSIPANVRGKVIWHVEMAFQRGANPNTRIRNSQSKTLGLGIVLGA